MQIFEAWLTTRLLASPTFHRAVQNVHRKIRHLRQGPDLEEMGGTKIDRVDKPTKNFLDHYVEEIKEQFRSQRK